MPCPVAMEPTLSATIHGCSHRTPTTRNDMTIKPTGDFRLILNGVPQESQFEKEARQELQPNGVETMTIKTINVHCPKWDARPGRPCTSSRISSCNSYGGGWGGYATLSRSHSERVQAAKAKANK